MQPVNPPTPTSSNNISWISRDSSKPEDQDIWFDAIDHVEMKETWFEGAKAFAPHEEHQAAPSSSAGEAADSVVPFTEDCRRGVQQFVRTLGEYGESRMLSACLSKILPGTPTSLVIAANSLYTAVTEGRNIDTAALHALGLVSGYLPENINVISQLAAFIRDTVTSWTDETFLQQFLDNEDNHNSTHLFTALAVTAIVAGRWMKDAGASHRGILKVPAFMANIFIRASHYWTALGNMAGSLPRGAEIPKNTGTSQHAPAFEVDTQIEMTGDVCDATASGTSAPRLTAFSSNSTAHPEAYTRATVENRPAPASGKNTRLSVPEQAHYLAVDKLRQESGLSDLLYCTNLKTETHQQTNEKVITNTHFNTKCDATVYPEPLTKGVESIPVHTDIPEIQVPSAATSRSVGEPLLPIVMTAATMATTSPCMQALKSKPVIVTGGTLALGGIIGGGILLLNKLSKHNPDERVDDIENELSRDATISNEEYNQAMELINSLEVSDLDFIFADSDATLAPGIRMKRDNRQQEKITLDFNEENIPIYIDVKLKKIRNVKIKKIFKEIFANNKKAPGKVEDSENFRVLLSSLDDIIIFLLNNKNTLSDVQFSEGRDVFMSFWNLLSKELFPFQYMKLVDKIYTNAIFITSTVYDVPQMLNFFINNIKDASFKREVESISEKAYASLDKAGVFAEDDKNILLLMEHISLLTDFSTHFEMKHGRKKSYKWSVELIKKLWKLADSLPESNSQFKIRNFAEYRQLVQSGGEVIRKLENLFPPIFDPDSYIDDFIDYRIKEFEKISGKKLDLKSNSTIHAFRYVFINGVRDPLKTAPVDVSLRDIVTNMYIVERGDNPYLSYDPSIKPLIEFLKKTHLQNRMLKELSDYKNDDANEKEMTTHYRQMIDYRCLHYLSPDNKDNKYASYVAGFLNGDVQAREFFFYNIKLNGVFFIPAGNNFKGVLFSVDEPTFFNLDSFEHTSYVNAHPYTENYTSTPLEPAFKEWVLSKIPIKERAEYNDETKPFCYPEARSALLASPPVVNLINHYLTHSQQMFNIKEIPTQLFNQLMERLQNDIDALNFSIEELDSFEREKFFAVLKLFYSITGLVIAPVAGIWSTAAFLGFVNSAIYAIISFAEAGIASAKGDKNANILMNEAMVSALLSLNSAARFNAPISSQNVIKTAVANYQKVNKLSKNAIPVIFKNRVKYSNFARNNNLPYRAMGPKLIKPKMSDFTNEHGVFNKEEFDKSMRKYTQEKGVIERMTNAGKNAPDECQRRKLIAENKMKILQGVHSYTLDSVTDNRFTLHYVKESPADTAVLSAHAWFTKDSTKLTLSGNQELLFLGPHGSILLEPPEVDNLLPMENLLAGKKNPLIYSRLTNKELISHTPGSSLSNDEVAMNYKLSHYEKVPDEEVHLSLLSNRIFKDKEKMDVITVNEKIDSPRYREPTLRDLMALIKKNESFQQYKKIIFLACREEKTPGVLRQSVKNVKLGSGYEIKFTDEDLASQSQIKKRDINSSDGENDINFDGYLIYEMITIEKDKASIEIKEIAPYIKMEKSPV
ncbi:putative adhesin [Erwinia mallotivora]|uniref:putative adhesin n=1 Tax=Erwinia mallotivora TaxID=69222 RepID=UPI0035E7945B